MRKITLIVITILSIISFLDVEAQTRKGMIDSLTTIDPEIRKYFPRWRICETDLQIQVYQSFKLVGFAPELLDKTKIEVLSAPHNDPYAQYDILLIKCGDATMNSAEIQSNFSSGLYNIISGESFFARAKNPPNTELRSRDYCYVEIPPETPVSSTEANAIVNFLRPTDVDHAFSLSLFDQSLKFGNSGFWISNIIGNDEVGYPFWSAGQSKIVLQRPLYANTNDETNAAIPYLIDFRLGGAYKINTGIDPSGSILSWVPARKLNMGPGGKLVAGFDFSMPFHPQFGLHFNSEIPLRTIKKEGIDVNDYAFTPVPDDVDFDPDNPDYGRYEISGIANQLRGTGQLTLFYNWWLGQENKNYDNFFRLDVGMSYAEVRQSAAYYDTTMKVHYMTPDGMTGLQTFKPSEFGDWVFAKLEYRNSAFWPFGMSVQYSNQILMGHLYVPLVNWLYLEAKVATPLRGLRPYETDVFFMVSPVIRLSI